MAKATAENSKCLSREIGAIAVRDGKYFVASGYNGPAVGCRHCAEISYRQDLFSKFQKENPTVGLTLPFGQAINATLICPRRLMGFPPKSGAGYNYCQAGHAERNVIATAARLGISLQDTVMYMTCGIPCLECAKGIINAGIREIVVTELADYATSGLLGSELFKDAGVKVRLFSCELP
jgi:deoxycytidylate deaminase